MFKNMDFHRYVAKKDFFSSKYEFWKSQTNCKLKLEECDASLYGKRIIMNKTMAYLRAFTCLSARLARGTCLHILHVPRAQHVRSTLGSLRFDDVNDNAINQ